MSGYEHLALTARNGETWRRAKLSAAEALLAQVEHNQPNPEERHNLLGRAQQHLTALVGHNRDSDQAAVVRERVSLQLGETVDWEHIDSTFATIVGGDYAGAIGRFLDRRHHGATWSLTDISVKVRITTSKRTRSPEQQKLLAMFEEAGTSLGAAVQRGAVKNAGGRGVDARPSSSGDSPGAPQENVAELLLIDFTSVELLQGLGQLYLSRARNLMSDHIAPDEGPQAAASRALQATAYAEQAYDCFDACRVLQVARGNESIVVKFLRGQAITLAADWARNPEPFSWSGKGNTRTLLSLGNGLLFAARSASVGQFNQVCAEILIKNRRLETELHSVETNGAVD